MTARFTRREFIQGSLALTAGAALTPAALLASSGPTIKSGRFADRFVILGFDGMDPVLTQKMMQSGELPNFSRLASTGYFGKLGTTMPPQSPVAWSSFITGTNPGGHGIYDFIHRDPTRFLPYLSTSRSFPAERKLEVGNWIVPIDSGRVDLMRKGVPFWDILLDHDIPSTIFSLPANFPVEKRNDKLRALSGMGTPDLLGGYGTYTVFTERPLPEQKRSGGKINLIELKNQSASAHIAGPASPFQKKSEPIQIEVKINRDPIEPVIKLEIAGQTIILQEGEWSDWVPLSFEFVPMFASMSGAVRVFARSVHPHLNIYVSPIQIDPLDPAMPICNPPDYSRELAEHIGRYYTQGLPADTKGLAEGALDSYAFLQQGRIVLAENMRAFEYEYARFKEGVFFFYFSSTDQLSHMLMRCMDPAHPLYEPNAVPEVKQAIRTLYKDMDKVVGQVLDRLDSRTRLMVLSDHGFTHFTREFNLSTWLVQEGFTAVSRPDRMHEMDFYQHVDWQRTKAYALGINGIYLNLRGRERRGTISGSEARLIKKDLIKRLEQVIDPKTGKRVVSRAFDAEQIYSGPYVGLAPDILVGYADGYRISDEAILGGFPQEIVRDRTNLWASDHCMDPAVVPGILLGNVPWKTENPGIWDLAPTILSEFGIQPPKNMTGSALRV